MVVALWAFAAFAWMVLLIGGALFDWSAKNKKAADPMRDWRRGGRKL